MPESTLKAVSEELIELAASGHEAPPFSARYPMLDADMGYRAMQRLHQHRLAIGWKPVGRKIGFTNRGIWPRYGVQQPIWGFVYDHTLIRAPDGRAEVPLEDLAQPRIEPEICFGLRAPPPRSHDPHAILAAVEWVAHSVEIVQTFHPGWKFALPDCTAANGLQGRLVLGPPVPVAKLEGLESRLASVEVALRKGRKIWSAAAAPTCSIARCSRSRTSWSCWRSSRNSRSCTRARSVTPNDRRPGVQASLGMMRRLVCTAANRAIECARRCVRCRTDTQQRCWRYCPD